MAIKAGSLIHVGNGVSIIDRVQSGGPGQLNIPTEKIYELGNYKSVATVRSTPDLSFTLNSLDTSTEIETLLTASYAGRNMAAAAVTSASTALTAADGAFSSADVGRMIIVTGAGTGGAELVTTIAAVGGATAVTLADAASTTVSGAAARVAPNGIDLAKVVPVDFAGQFKGGINATDPFKVVTSVAFPYLNTSQVQYQFGLSDNASQNITLNGDTIFYNPGATFVETATGTGTANQAVVTAHPAFQVAQGDARRVLAVTADNQRLTLGADYTETYGTVTDGAAVTTVTILGAVPSGAMIRIIYSSPDSVSYAQTVHADTVVKPAAVKGRDIEVYVGGYDPNDVVGSQVNKMLMAQSVSAQWTAQLTKDEELGNHYAVAQDFDTPTVSGSVDIKPRDAAFMAAVIRKITGVTDTTKVIGPDTAALLALDVIIKHPDTGKVVKRIHVPDARFTVPGYSGQVQQRMTQSLQWESDGGTLQVFER